MLVISRKVSESILIGEDIEIMITDIGADKVKISIQAPRSISILRKELLETSHLNEEASIAPQKQSLERFKELARSLPKNE